MVPCWQVVWGVTVKICYFRCPVWKIEKLIKSKPTRKLKHAVSILEYFEDFYQMSSKSILTILRYSVSKLTRFLRHSVYYFWSNCSRSFLLHGAEKLCYIFGEDRFIYVDISGWPDVHRTCQCDFIFQCYPLQWKDKKQPCKVCDL